MNEIRVKFIPPVRWYMRAKWQLLQPYASHNQAVTVPTGFITDGASIPFFLRWGFSSTGKYFGAAIIHDYVLMTDGGWPKANDEFNKEMKALKVSVFRRRVIIAAVKIYSKVCDK